MPINMPSLVWVDSAKTPLKRTTHRALSAGSKKAAAGYLTVKSAIAGGKAILGTDIEYQNVESILGTLPGGPSGAAREMEFLHEESNR
jgi:hypothetical protein